MRRCGSRRIAAAFAVVGGCAVGCTATVDTDGLGGDGVEAADSSVGDGANDATLVVADATSDATEEAAADATGGGATDGGSDGALFDAAADANDLPLYVQEVLVLKPVAYWRFEETLGSVAYSSAGDAGLEGIYQPLATLGAPGALGAEGGYAVDFVLGANAGQGGVHFDNAGKLAGNARFTFEWWFRPTAAPEPSPVLPTLFALSGNETSPYTFFYSPHFSNDLALELGNPATEYAIPTRATPPVGAWTYLVVTFDGLDITFYENTSIIYGPASFSTASAADGGTVSQFTIGSDFAGNNDFNGEIDEFAIYDQTLDSATIVQHYLAAGPHDGPEAGAPDAAVVDASADAAKDAAKDH